MAPKNDNNVYDPQGNIDTTSRQQNVLMINLEKTTNYEI